MTRQEFMLAVLAAGDGEAHSPVQVQKLFFVLKNTDWSLELRPVVDAADSAERAESIHTVVHDGLSQAALNRVLNGVN